MKIKEKSTEEKVIRKYLLRLRQPRIKKKENRYYIRGYKGTEVIIRTDHEILKRIAYRRTCVKQVCIPGRYETETKYIYMIHSVVSSIDSYMSDVCSSVIG